MQGLYWVNAHGEEEDVNHSESCLISVIPVQGSEGGKATDSKKLIALLKEFCVHPKAKGTCQQNE